jgi:putative membrane protein
MKKLTKKQIIPFIVIIGVIIIPLLYSYFYLGAFWDPYSRLEKLPIAIVNEDTGAMIQGQKRNLGEELCTQLKNDNSLKFEFTDAETAKNGMQGTKYYAMLSIPKNFSLNIASSGDVNKEQAVISYAPNEKRNFLATQILNNGIAKIEKELIASVDTEIVGQLSDKLQSMPDQLSDLSNGLGKMSDGSEALCSGLYTLKNGTNSINSGSASLYQGTSTYVNKLGEFKAGMDTAVQGSSSINEGIASLDSGLNDLVNGANSLSKATDNITALKTGSAQLAQGAESFSQNLTNYTAGVDQLIQKVNGLTQTMGSYALVDPVAAKIYSELATAENVQKLKALSAGSSQLNAASSNIAAGAKQLKDGTANVDALKAGIEQIKTGLTQAKEGSSQLSAGASSLNNGMVTLGEATNALSDGAVQLNQGAKQLANGSTSLNDGTDALVSGASQLNSGLKDAKTGVDTAVNSGTSQLDALNGLDTFAAHPVTIETNAYQEVPNYGTAFAPYFMSLSMFVGGLMIFFGIYLDADNKFKLLARDSEKKVLRSILYLVIGLVQAIVLGFVLLLALGLNVQHIFMFFVSCCLVSVVFIAIIQFFLVFFKDVGKFLCIAFLILQLTSCGGTFPMELVPKFYNVLFPFMPMTYSVGLFKEAVSGTVGATMFKNGMVLLVILIIVMTLTIILSSVKKKNAAAALER